MQGAWFLILASRAWHLRLLTISIINTYIYIYILYMYIYIYIILLILLFFFGGGGKKVKYVLFDALCPEPSTLILKSALGL